MPNAFDTALQAAQQQQQRPNLFADCDGVLADFNAHVQARFGAHPDRFKTDDLWDKINSDPEFFLHIPLMPDAKALWDSLRPYKPIVLTGCPASNFALAAAQKTIWVKGHFGQDVEVITCLGREKYLHLRQAKDILIDDRSSNIKRWIRAGGHGIRHRDAVTTLRVLETYLNCAARS